MGFTSFSIVFQSYKDDWSMIQKSVCNETPFTLKAISSSVGIQPGTARSALNLWGSISIQTVMKVEKNQNFYWPTFLNGIFLSMYILFKLLALKSTLIRLINLRLFVAAIEITKWLFPRRPRRVNETYLPGCLSKHSQTLKDLS